MGSAKFSDVIEGGERVGDLISGRLEKDHRAITEAEVVLTHSSRIVDRRIDWMPSTRRALS